MVWRNGAQRCWYCDSTEHLTSDCSQRNFPLEGKERKGGVNQQNTATVRPPVPGGSNPGYTPTYSLKPTDGSVTGEFLTRDGFIVGLLFPGKSSETGAEARRICDTMNSSENKEEVARLSTRVTKLENAIRAAREKYWNGSESPAEDAVAAMQILREALGDTDG